MTVVEELTLFGTPAPTVRRSDPPTSKLAAKRLIPGPGQHKVLRALLRLERATDAEIREAPECRGMGYGSAVKRRSECQKYGWIRACGVQGRGRSRLIWTLTAAGYEEAIRPWGS